MNNATNLCYRGAARLLGKRSTTTSLCRRPWQRESSDGMSIIVLGIGHEWRASPQPRLRWGPLPTSHRLRGPRTASRRTPAGLVKGTRTTAPWQREKLIEPA